MEKITKNQAIDSGRKNLSGIILETPAEYVVKSKSDIKCIVLEELTSAEKIALGNYQDIHPWNEQKRDWSFEIPEAWHQKAYCYSINNCCRHSDFYDKMKHDEKELIDFHIENLDSAIEKGRVKGNPFVYRGVSGVDWLPEDHSVGTEYVDDAYGSFSLKLGKALEYTNSQKPIIFQLKIKPKMKALKIDDSEFEVLRPRKSNYIIVNISKHLIKSSEDELIEVIFYKIEEVKK
ncbi:hypothetical protein MmiEs2_15800 [Methanimicrococcus stummii]|uniref:ADP ribosyltransferase domain-containing protein n=1 Tax=Methanimicrococcus stummii TaxID=3028294 RepID=A0AA96VAQ0_9EURY|nr:ADP-ribosyltransferase [Methanimicrococcus sp. Es2]WNY29353.1 hypothetical protein MmiEs2_15800 [Methanimicrococcus sp. Es2]